MKKVKMLRKRRVNGRVARPGEIVECSPRDAGYLCARGMAEPAEGNAAPKPPTQPKPISKDPKPKLGKPSKPKGSKNEKD